MREELFTITKEHLDTGLRGYPVGYCSTSFVDSEKGLFYLGKPVAELSKKEPIEVIYLLYHGEEGTKEEIEKFSNELNKRAQCKEETLGYIEKLPRKGHPMELFSSALMILSMVEPQADYQEACLHLIAKIPQIAAAVINYHAGWGKTPPSQPEKGYMENFVHMLQIPNKKEEVLTPLFKLFAILHYDHGGGNLSAFVGKAVASGLEHLYGSVAAAMNALAGPRHGKANQDCLEFVKKVLQEVGEKATGKQVEELIRKKLENHELVFGFGHAVLRVEDPRATLFYQFANDHFPNDPFVKIAALLRVEGPKVLSENEKITDPYPNIDAISGVCLAASGFSFPEYFTILFGLARAVGISMQIVYERCIAREKKGVPIYRPKYLFKR